LRATFPRHGAKRAATLAGRSVRTAQSWFAARCVPSSADLIRMARQNDALRAELIRTLEATNEEPRQMVLPLDATEGAAPCGVVDRRLGVVRA
jgi:hypothetical protein